MLAESSQAIQQLPSFRSRHCFQFLGYALPVDGITAAPQRFSLVQ